MSGGSDNSCAYELGYGVTGLAPAIAVDRYVQAVCGTGSWCYVDDSHAICMYFKTRDIRLYLELDAPAYI